MPVTHQWKAKAKVEEQQQQQPPQAQPSQSAGKKAGDAEEQQPGKKGKPFQISKKDDKHAKAAEAAIEARSEEDEKSAEDDEDSNQPGRIKNLAGFFATQKDDPKNVKKKRFEVSDDPQTIILENEPVERLEGVIRSDDPGEWQKPIELEKGWAKNMASLFQNRQEDIGVSKKPFVMDIAEGAETIILENEPVRLEGVVRSVDKTEDVIGKRGRIKNIAGRFTNPQYDDTADGGGEESSGGSSKPKWMLELESAKEYGVFENEPVVRSDVVRAEDEQPDVISAQHTRNLRKMWTQIEKEENREKEPRRPDIVIRPKKKEPSPEPPPPPPPVEEPKPTRRFGASANVRGNASAFGTVYGKFAKKEKTPPPAPPPEPEPPKQDKRRGFRQTQQSSTPTTPAVTTPDSTDPKNPFKTSLKAVQKRK